MANLTTQSRNWGIKEFQFLNPWFLICNSKFWFLNSSIPKSPHYIPNEIQYKIATNTVFTPLIESDIS